MTKAKAGLTLNDQAKVEIECGMHGVAHIFIANATMAEMGHLRDVMEMPEPADDMEHTEGIPDACKPLIRSCSVDDPFKQLVYGIPDPGVNGGLIRVVKFYASMREAEEYATLKLPELLGPMGVELRDYVLEWAAEGEKYRKKFMKDLEEKYEKKHGKKL